MTPDRLPPLRIEDDGERYYAMNEPIFTCEIPGSPVPKQRARKGGSGWYTPTPTVRAEENIVAYVRQTIPGLRVDEESEFRLELEFYLRPYPGDSQAPDIDNLLKLVLDALNTVVYKDDQQVLEVQMRKHLNSDNPRTVFSVFKI